MCICCAELVDERKPDVALRQREQLLRGRTRKAAGGEAGEERRARNEREGAGAGARLQRSFNLERAGFTRDVETNRPVGARQELRHEAIELARIELPVDGEVASLEP